MFILTRADRIENCIDNIYRVQAPDMEKQYLEAGLKRREHVYKLKDQYKEFTVICPEFRNAVKDAGPVVIIPEFLVPRRPYPIYVYLYAIDLYSSNPNMGQREAAEATREKFGLESFAHTTLGRALKKFVHNVLAVDKPAEACRGDAIGNAGDEEERQNTNGANVIRQEEDGSNQPGFPTTRSTDTLRKRAARILSGKASQGIPQQVIKFCIELAGTWFKRYCRFLL